ncbi:pyridoxamine 5'-phosphate oxidase family protein [Enterococcus sp. 669A]|uniref:Pyridoxamine 5'-phosphate oxidase family protein n=1 Tax=Candidatus Enterococcus moelleringii TaxID=2815325 RepID=A0ABS3L7W3_9ENTE|nr:pyridoxamine 5'-phosphate oxidase family protein [Enterococcus sp. 669A]MBO1305707.1 pyridoxamine 5'-phosphate oxidase family protein [Enterococcus sp. 669A]
MEDHFAFFKGLNYEDGLSVVTAVFKKFPLQYGTTLGLDGNPQIRPLEFKFEEDGVLYFDTVVYYTSYKEMQAHPCVQICVCDQSTMSYVRVSGTVNFTDDPAIIDRCFENSPVLTSQFSEHRETVIGYYLTNVQAEFMSFAKELPAKTYQLRNKYDQQPAK